MKYYYNKKLIYVLLFKNYYLWIIIMQSWIFSTITPVVSVI